MLEAACAEAAYVADVAGLFAADPSTAAPVALYSGNPRVLDPADSFWGAVGVFGCLIAVLLAYWGRIIGTSAPRLFIYDPTAVHYSSGGGSDGGSSWSSGSSGSSYSSGGSSGGGGGSFGGGGASGSW